MTTIADKNTHVWVTQGRTEHYAILLEPLIEGQDTVLVKWCSAGSKESVPGSSVRLDVDINDQGGRGRRGRRRRRERGPAVSYNEDDQPLPEEERPKKKKRKPKVSTTDNSHPIYSNKMKKYPQEQQPQPEEAASYMISTMENTITSITNHGIANQTIHQQVQSSSATAAKHNPKWDSPSSERETNFESTTSKSSRSKSSPLFQSLYDSSTTSKSSPLLQSLYDSSTTSKSYGTSSSKKKHQMDGDRTTTNNNTLFQTTSDDRNKIHCNTPTKQTLPRSNVQKPTYTEEAIAMMPADATVGISSLKPNVNDHQQNTTGKKMSIRGLSPDDPWKRPDVIIKTKVTTTAATTTTTTTITTMTSSATKCKENNGRPVLGDHSPGHLTKDKKNLSESRANQQRDEMTDTNIAMKLVSTAPETSKWMTQWMTTPRSKRSNDNISKEPDSQAKVSTTIMLKPLRETSTCSEKEKTSPKQVDQVRATTTMLSKSREKSTKQTLQSRKVQVLESAMAASSSKIIGNNSQTGKSQKLDHQNFAAKAINIKATATALSKNNSTRIDNPPLKVAHKDKAPLKTAESDQSTILLPIGSCSFKTSIESEKFNSRSLPLKTRIKMKASADQKIWEMSSDDDSKVEGSSRPSRAFLMHDLLKNETKETASPSVNISNNINRSNWKRIENLKKERNSVNQSNWKQIERLKMKKQGHARVALS
jgi:hypothetical protein